MIRFTKKEVKECENSDGTKTNVLDIEYKIKKDTGRVLVKDYYPKTKRHEKIYIKAIRNQIAKQYLDLNQ